MKSKFNKIAAVSLTAIFFGVFSITAFGQNISELKAKINHYDNLIVQWSKYRDETVLPYYNNPKYSRWAQKEYQKANQQIANAQKYKVYYQTKFQQMEKAILTGTETITQECWYKVAGSPCVMIYGRIYWYDNGTNDSTDYYKKRDQMTRAGYSFAWAKEYSRKRFGDPKYVAKPR